ncbi:hypothetical protein ANN_03337 [Periplaneta americana]|uniref:Uncharacterized protein n=1 Tax=Periplaneta americana TaxID=6978 RepID=A0ABQ8TYQ7_PERAM|nr:hypothetical protein ANN_03337 [Periplaneta americana]
MPGLNPKSLRSAYEGKAYVTIDSDSPVGWDVKPGGPLGAIRQDDGLRASRRGKKCLRILSTCMKCRLVHDITPHRSTSCKTWLADVVCNLKMGPSPGIYPLYAELNHGMCKHYIISSDRSQWIEDSLQLAMEHVITEETRHKNVPTGSNIEHSRDLEPGADTVAAERRSTHHFASCQQRSNRKPIVFLRKIFGAKRDEVTGEWRKLSLGFSEPTHARYEMRGPPRTNPDYTRDSEWFLWLRSASFHLTSHSKSESSNWRANRIIRTSAEKWSTYRDDDDDDDDDNNT